MFYVLGWSPFTRTIVDLVVKYRNNIAKRLTTYKVYM